MKQSTKLGLRLVTALVMAASVGDFAAAQSPAGKGGVRRDGHTMVRVQVPSQAALQTLYQLGAELWSCSAGVGPVDFVVSPPRLDALRAMNLPFEILIDDVQAEIDAERERLEQGQPEGVSWFADFKTYPQVNAYIDSLVAQRPDLVSKLTVGTTLEGRTMYAMRISGPGAPGSKPAVVFNGCQHAREWISVMVPMYVADRLVNLYEADVRIHGLVDAVEWYIVPIVNVDGYEFTYAPGGDRMWRKNRRPNAGGSIGVDVNRNWSVDWGGIGASTVPNDPDYCGTGPFSEPESTVLRNFIAARPNLIAHIDFHSYGQLVLQTMAWTNAQPPQARLVDQLSGFLNAGIFSINGLSYSGGTGPTLLYVVSGGMRDWVLVERGIFGHTIELRDTMTFLLPPAQIMPTCTEAFEAALRSAEWSLQPVQFMFTTGQPATIEANQTTNLRLEIHPVTSGALDPSTALLWWRVGASGPFSSSPLSSPGSNIYQATLPATPCSQTLQYYIEIEAQSGGTIYRSPSNAPAAAHQAAALGTQSILTDNFQTALGWTASGVTNGRWERGVPVNDINWPYDPFADADGSGGGGGQCYVTQNTLGNSDVDSGSVVLTSPVIDMSNAGLGILISYDYFLRLSNVNTTDRLLVEINSTNGSGAWTEIARHNTDGSLNWRSNQVTQAQLTALGVNLTSQMRLRFTANDASPASMVEAGVDNVRVRRVICNTPPCPADIALPLNNIVDIDDLLAVINAWGPCTPPCPPDINNTGAVDIDDLLAVINAWGPCP